MAQKKQHPAVMAPTIVIRGAPALLQMALMVHPGQVPADGVTVVATFPADNGPGYKVIPDTQGAVGPNHVVDFDGLNFVVHDKQMGTVLVKKSQREFWASAEPANTLIAPNPWDPRFLYDTTSGRWMGVIASDGHGLGVPGRIDLIRSHQTTISG